MSHPTGPRLGAVTDTSATIKFNVTGTASGLELVLATDPELTRERQRFSPADVWSDPSGRYLQRIATFEAEGLRPSTSYHYAIYGGEQMLEGARGEFRSLPLPGQARPFRFAASSCDKYQRKEAFQAILAEEDLLFFLYLGDLYYDIDERSVPERLERYDEILARGELRDLWSRLPVPYTWDDHDFLGNNIAGGTDADGSRTARAAYERYFPHYPLAVGGTIAQSFVVGNALFILTDTRSLKSAPEALDGLGKSMLGEEQLEWLQETLLAGRSRDIVFWINSTPWIARPRRGQDHWGGYDHERRQIAAFVKDHGIGNLCMISGDAHMLAFDDGSNSPGAFPVYQNASLGSRGSEKGGPYSGPIRKGRRHYGLFELRYDGDGPVLEWAGMRAASVNGQMRGERLLQHRFRPG